MHDINSTAREILQKRKTAAEDKSDYYRSLAEQNAEYKSLSAQLKGLELDIARAEYLSDTAAVKSLKNEYTQTQSAVNGLLKKMGISASLLIPSYSCKKCGDTGYIDGRVCECLDSLSYKLFCGLFNQDTDSFPRFENAKVTALNEREFELFKKFADKFPNVKTRTFMLCGKSGTGKTFLSQCAAKALIDKGKKVVFVSAFNLINTIKEYHYSFNKSASNLIGTLSGCDLLVIDDLGTEPMIKNITQEYLLNILSLRQGQRLCTVFTTNLTLDGIGAAYDERIFARLTDLNLTGIINLSDKLNFRR